MLLLLSVLLLKFFYLEDTFNFIKEEFNKGIPFEVLSENVISKINEILKIDEDELYNNLSDEGKVEINIEDKNIVENLVAKSGETEYITAVEGVNQLLEDSDYIKENYVIKSPLNGTITSVFGARESDNPLVSSYHSGLDIAANKGTIIIAAHSGKVIQAGDNGTYGKSITIEDGDLKTLYAHCSEVLVKKGDNVNIGQKIGKVGMTGNATGPHLHFEIRYQGRFVNPQDII